jgi:ADP-ribosylglycohydrolase
MSKCWSHQRNSAKATMSLNRQTQTRRSAVWAAYGDALGFITELADADRVQYRSGSSSVTHTIEWRRKIGGLTGTTVVLPAGAYSDDTQLRLSTSRAIRGDGIFDVAAFAKVELPAWGNYALGAGLTSREAAASLARTSATWYSNFFETKRATYIKGGGNGAAMRIQPHVWSAVDLKNHGLIFRDAIRNAICTHGHPRGIVGACFHAASLARALDYGAPPTLQDCVQITASLRSLPEVIHADGDLRLFWLGPWTEQIGDNVENALGKAVDELAAEVRALSKIQEDDLAKAYDAAIDLLDARKPESRGSGTKTSLLATFLAARCDLSRPSTAMELVANSLGSDTDSIATMAGAIIGACSPVECSAPLQDRRYIESEASRLAAVANREQAPSFRYPDLRSWKPARAAIDAVANGNDGLVLDGIGRLRPQSGSRVAEGNGEKLQWFELEFGQTILARVKEVPRQLSKAQDAISTPDPPLIQAIPAVPRMPDLFSGKEDRGASRTEPALQERSATLNETLQEVIESGFAPDVIGRVLLAQVRPGRSNFVERGIALTSTILTAYEARIRKRK